MKYIDMHCDTISEIWYSRLLSLIHISEPTRLA